MTCIVAVRDGTRVCMAADSQSGQGGIRLTGALPKIRVLPGPVENPRRMLLGFSGPHLLYNALEIPKALHSPDSYNTLQAWAVVAFVPWLRAFLKERDALEAKDGMQWIPGETIIACGPDFVTIDRGGGVYVHAADYAAIGSGASEARGAMWSSSPATRPDYSPRSLAVESIARNGVLAAIELDESCGPPVVVEWTDP